jgi:hypothetical protein
VKYLNMGTSDYEVYVPSSPLPVILGTREADIDNNGGLVLLRTRLCYPERTYLCPLSPKGVIELFCDAESKVPGLNYD